MYENYVVPLQRRARKSRQATKGVGLHKTTQSMGTRMPISIVKGNRRPHDPSQAAKFASEAGVSSLKYQFSRTRNITSNGSNFSIDLWPSYL